MAVDPKTIIEQSLIESLLHMERSAARRQEPDPVETLLQDFSVDASLCRVSSERWRESITTFVFESNAVKVNTSRTLNFSVEDLLGDREKDQRKLRRKYHARKLEADFYERVPQTPNEYTKCWADTLAKMSEAHKRRMEARRTAKHKELSTDPTTEHQPDGEISAYPKEAVSAASTTEAVSAASTTEAVSAASTTEAVSAASTTEAVSAASTTEAVSAASTTEAVSAASTTKPASQTTEDDVSKTSQQQDATVSSKVPSRDADGFVIPEVVCPKVRSRSSSRSKKSQKDSTTDLPGSESPSRRKSERLSSSSKAGDGERSESSKSETSPRSQRERKRSSSSETDEKRTSRPVTRSRQ